jgi:perosamine synthetase
MLEKENTEWILPLYKIYTDDEDLNLITKIIKRGNRWALGPEIEEFENLIKKYLNVDYCLTFNSGTSALHALFLAYGFNSNDEIIIPSFSFISTANSVLFVNATPVFADIEEETFGLSIESISKKISPKTKCLVPMDYGGSSCKIHEIKEFAVKNNLIVIEDAAESFGASVNGAKVGSISDSSMFSFCGNKVLTTGEGGAIVTNSKEIFEKAKLIRSHGRVDNRNYFENPQNAEYLGIGYNWRMSSITAALGISQLNKLDKIIKMRQENAKYISSKISKIPQITIPNSPKNHEHIFQMYTIKLSSNKLRNKLHKFLLTKKIFSKVYFNPIHLTEYYIKKFNTKKGMLPMTEMISEQILTLPMYPNMTLEEKNYLIDSICEFFESNTEN